MADGALKGRVAVVTGGNGGIGLGMARGLAAAGAAVVVSGRNAEKSRGAVAELAKLGATAVAIEVDVADEAAVNALVRATVDRFGRLDILVNNAGMNIRKPVHELTLAEWRQVLDTNLTSAFLTSRAVYPIMKKNGRRQDHQHRLDDVHLRHVVRARLRGLQGRHRPAHQGDRHPRGPRDNIQVNAVLPGWIDTELTRTRAEAGRRASTTACSGARRPRAGACPTTLRRRGLPRRSRLRFRHRDRDPGGRRLFDPGLTCGTIARRVTCGVGVDSSWSAPGDVRLRVGRPDRRGGAPPGPAPISALRRRHLRLRQREPQQESRQARPLRQLLLRDGAGGDPVPALRPLRSRRCPASSAAEYAERVKQVVARAPWEEPWPADQRIVIPGYASLHEFSARPGSGGEGRDWSGDSGRSCTGPTGAWCSRCRAGSRSVSRARRSPSWPRDGRCSSSSRTSPRGS